MFNKKIGLVLLILVFMLSLCAVAAEDNTTAQDNDTIDVDEEPPSSISNDLSMDKSFSLQKDNSDNYTITSKDINVYYEGTANYEAVLSLNQQPINNVSIIINVNGVNYNETTDANGKVSIELNSTKNNCVVSASYGNVTVTNNIKVLPVIKANNIVKTYKCPKSYSATFLNSNGNLLTNTNVKFTIKGKTYVAKTNSQGIATIKLNLKVGKYTVKSIHPNGYVLSNQITIKPSIQTKDLQKYYKSSKNFKATFYDKEGKVLSKKYIKFKYRGSTIVKKTNKKGKATLKLTTRPGTYKVISINPVTGEQIENKITVLPTLYAKDMSVFTGTKSKFKVTLYKNGKLAKHKKLKIYVDGAKKKVKTDNEGVASVKFKLDRGKYNFKSVDPYTGFVLNKKVTVKLASVKAISMAALENHSSVFQARLYQQNGKVAKSTTMEIIINGVSHKVKTNSKGYASVDFKFEKGTYEVISKDLSTGYSVTSKIYVVDVDKGTSYDKNGVSEDGKTLLAVGRPSANGEQSKYGYKFYMVEFDRTCPYCGSHELYWSIFWAGSESGDVGTFPATGHKEPSSAEGGIFCAHCDCDFSIFGKNRGSTGGNLKAITKPVKVTKELAYLLLSGYYIKI
ncbi:MAG: hypothetical protein E7Z80_02810 [Methanobrevibacter thaueri]|nr:hypothetical protein [Methanobrevibacter thaueri]